MELLPELQPKDDGIWALYPLNQHLPQKVRLLLDYLQQMLPQQMLPQQMLPQQMLSP